MTANRHSREASPHDGELFAPAVHRTLRRAVTELSWLLSRGYADRAALKLVGDRYELTARQRAAVCASACADEALARRRAKHRSRPLPGTAKVGIDGFNLLITLESALSGGVLLIGRDGCCRDLASVRGCYHRVKQTPAAIALAARRLATLAVPQVEWFFDQPVSNSGRLRRMMVDRLQAEPVAHHIELVADPDRVLAAYPGLVVSSDSWILDHCRQWTNLAAAVVEALNEAWLVDLSDEKCALPPIEEVAK